MTRWLIISLALCLAVASACVYVGLLHPELLRERIPTHWDINMQPDGWTDRDHYYRYLFLLPGVMVFMTCLMWLLPKISPQGFRIEPFAGTFGYVMTVVVGFFGYLATLQIWVGMADSKLWPQFFVAGFFLLFGLLGQAMRKVRRNYWMGVRTPWTLSNEVVWDRTHQLTATLWVSAGLLGGVLVLAGLPFWVGLIILLPAVFWPIFYSLWLYKRLERQGRT
jgi:uncharacterized membrane protein